MEGRWIGLIKKNKVKFFGIRVFNELIKVFGVCYMYDVKIVKRKEFK